MQKLFTALLVVAISSSAACNGPREAEEAKAKTEAAVKAAEGAARAAEQATAAAARAADSGAAASMSDLAKVLSGAAATGPDGKPVESLGTDALARALPRVPGWEMSTPDGIKLNSPFPISETKTTYRKGDARIDLKVTDAAMAQMMLLPWSMMMQSGYTRETPAGYEKAVTVGGHPGFEKWNQRTRRGELNLLVNNRFMVTIAGNDLADTSLLHEFGSKVNASALK